MVEFFVTMGWVLFWLVWLFTLFISWAFVAFVLTANHLDWLLKKGKERSIKVAAAVGAINILVFLTVIVRLAAQYFEQFGG